MIEEESFDAREVAAYYSQFIEEYDFNALEGQSCIYLPASSKNVLDALLRLREEGMLKKGQRFLDAGAGDGRVVAVAAALGLRALGVELHNVTHKKAMERIEVARRKGLLNAPASMVLGDFLSDEPFDDLPFGSFHVIYNYHNNHEKLAERIARESQRGTLFLLYTTIADRPDFRGLAFRGSIELRDPRPRGILFPKADMLVYEKV